MTNRTHFSIKEELIIPFKYNQKNDLKPEGLWYGIDGDWKSWCESEMPHWIKDRNEFILELNFDKILIISSIDELDLFHNEFSILIGKTIHDIDWKKIAQLYTGIEIHPYLYERRYEYLWYYGWDCSSGCIWDSSAIKKIIKNELSTETQSTSS